MGSGSQDAPGANVTAAAAAAVAAAAAAAAAAGTPISNSTHWSTEETKLLIKTWGDYRDEFAEIKRNLSVWNKVLERLLGAGFFRTVEQCRNRWKFLETKYRAAIRDIDEKGRTPWEFFDDMAAAKRGADSPQPPPSREQLYHAHKRNAREAEDDEGGIGGGGGGSRSPASSLKSRRRLSPGEMSESAHQQHQHQQQQAQQPPFADAHGRVHLPPIRAHEASPLLHQWPRTQQQQQQQPPPPTMSHSMGNTNSNTHLHPHPHSHCNCHQNPLQHLQSQAAPAAPFGLGAHSRLQQPSHSSPASRPAALTVALRSSYAPHHHHARTSSAESMRPEHLLETHPARNLPPSASASASAAAAAASILSSIDTAHDRDSAPASRHAWPPCHSQSQSQKPTPSADHTLNDAASPPLLIPPGIDGAELTGTVRRADLLEFLRELARLREQREAIRVEERKRYEELCSTEEWRFHEFQMSLVTMVQTSLAPHADAGSDADEIQASPCAPKSHRRSSSSSSSIASAQRRARLRAPSNTTTTAAAAKTGAASTSAAGSRFTFVAEPANISPQRKDGLHTPVPPSSVSEEGEVADDTPAVRPRFRAPSTSFASAHLSATIAKAESPCSPLRRRTNSADDTETADPTNHHLSSTSSSPLEVRPIRA
ncbi:hypothetical protein H4217_001302 [Coemansia sp. RSA 1939]|nr:hypothetical protein H4217_001302 [Coemansia sp. RSA 1939]KAJ2616219.1 hypothetical protein EV177_001168 [Coemansia sp. RSA 1804]KAJ2694848.1 hypothetical protein GGH99_000467 [Coemansia sp. RSA 1285]